jgi:hypothetical protein
MALLACCTCNGAAVSFLPSPAATAAGAVAAPAPGTAVRTANDTVGETWDVLARARLEALAGLSPDWRIWLDRHAWHARRRDPFLQHYQPGAPAFHVTASNSLELAAQLYCQQAAPTRAATVTRTAS